MTMASDGAILSDSQSAESFSSRFRSDAALFQPLNQLISPASDLQVEGGYIASVDGLRAMHPFFQQLVTHCGELVDAAAAMFEGTDSAVAADVLSTL